MKLGTKKKKQDRRREYGKEKENHFLFLGQMCPDHLLDLSVLRKDDPRIIHFTPPPLRSTEVYRSHSLFFIFCELLVFCAFLHICH